MLDLLVVELIRFRGGVDHGKKNTLGKCSPSGYVRINQPNIPRSALAAPARSIENINSDDYKSELI